MIRKYGREFNIDSLLSVEYLAFREGWTVEQGGLGRHKHFENIVRETWPEFYWYTEAYEQAEALCNEKVTGFMAGASFTKSDLMGKYGEVSWFADPANTLVIVCSTTALDAKMRIWGHIVRDYRKARGAQKAVGRLIESQSIIKLADEDGLAGSDNASICLVAAGDQYKDDAVKRLQGRKNKKVLLLVDEGQDVSQAIVDEALWNLSANDHFEVHMAGNGSSRYDSLGNFMKPIEGWQSVNRTTHRWKIRVGGREGVALHFDATAEHSANMKRFAQGVPQLPFLRKAEDVISARTHLGESNATYMRQFVGFPPDSEGESSFIVTEQALSSHQASDRAEWKTAPTEVAGLDPSYSSDGDRFIFHHCRWGLTTHDVWTFEYFEYIQIKPRPIPGETKDAANIRECKRIAEERNISPRFVGMDSSAGTALLSMAHQMWSPEILGVPFGGAATDLPISTWDKRIASDIYANATSELAYVFVEFLNAGQIRGVKSEHAKELTARQFEIVAGNKVKIESKKDMKKRLGFSPDIADAGAVALRVVRERLRVQAGAGSPQAGNAGRDWQALARSRDVAAISQGQRSGKPSDLATKVLDSAAMHTRTMERFRDMLSKRVF